MKHKRCIAAVLATVLLMGICAFTLFSASAFDEYEEEPVYETTGNDITDQDTSGQDSTNHDTIDFDTTGYDATEDHSTDYDPTGHCTEQDMYYLTGGSNYCPAIDAIQGYFYGSHTLVFVAPGDLDILSFQFKLYRESPAITLNTYSSFTQQMAYATRDDMIMLSGSFSSLSPVSVREGEALLTVNVSVDTMEEYFTSYPMYEHVHLEIEDMMVSTPDGDKIIIDDGIVVHDPKEPSTEPTTQPDTVEIVSTGSVEFTVALTDPYDGVIVGDVDRNGVVEINDATMIQQHLAEFTDKDGNPIIDENNDYQFYVTDVDRNGKITIGDVTEIQRYLAEFIRVLG